MFARIKAFLLITVYLFIAVAVVPSTASSELLWPLYSGYTYQYLGEGLEYEYQIINEKVTIDSLDYFHSFFVYQDLDDLGFFRSTENEFYKYNPDGDDLLLYQIADVNTEWSYYEEYYDDDEDQTYHYVVRKIDAIESVEVPYGTFDGAYKYQSYRCKDPANPGDPPIDRTAYYYEWIVPNLGPVKTNEYFYGEPGFDWTELTEIIPPHIGYSYVQRRRYEDGREPNRFYADFRNYFNWNVPAEYIVSDPEASITLYDDADPQQVVPLINERLWSWNVAFGYYNSESDFYYPNEFHYEGYLFAEIPDDLVPGTTYHLEVTGIDDNTYISEYLFNDFVDLPFIKASTFVTNFDAGDNFIWQWTPNSPIPADTSLKANITLFNGETYIGDHWIGVPSDINQLSIPGSKLRLNSSNRLKLQIHIRTEDNSNNRTYSNLVSIPLDDDDKDSISDEIDTNGAYSDDFNDGQTYGTIIDRADQVLAITDAAENEDGVLIAASCASATGLCPNKAIIEVCGGTQYHLDAGDEIVVTCGSVITKVISGTVEIEFEATDGTIATTTLDEGNELEFDPDSITFIAPESNPDPVIVVVDGVEISVTPGEETMVSKIDIKPRSRRNRIILWRWGHIPVAILSSEGFDAPNDVERSTITFGKTGDEDSLVRCARRARDVNRDGLKDLICVFRTRDTGFEVGDTVGILKSETSDGINIQGSDSVIIIGW